MSEQQSLLPFFTQVTSKAHQKTQVKKIIREQLTKDAAWSRQAEVVKAEREKLRLIEQDVVARELEKEAAEIDNLKFEVECAQEALTAAALTAYRARKDDSEEITVKDDNGTEWVPIFKVRFKKKTE